MMRDSSLYFYFAYLTLRYNELAKRLFTKNLKSEKSTNWILSEDRFGTSLKIKFRERFSISESFGNIKK